MPGHPEERCNCHRNEPVPRINLMMGLVRCQHASLIGFRIDCIKQTFQAGNDTRERFTLIMWFLHFGEEPVNEDDGLGKIRFRFLKIHLNTIITKTFMWMHLSVYTSKIKNTSMGSNFPKCVPTMALYCIENAVP